MPVFLQFLSVLALPTLVGSSCCPLTASPSLTSLFLAFAASAYQSWPGTHWVGVDEGLGVGETPGTTEGWLVGSRVDLNSR